MLFPYTLLSYAVSCSLFLVYLILNMGGIFLNARGILKIYKISVTIHYTSCPMKVSRSDRGSILQVTLTTTNPEYKDVRKIWKGKMLKSGGLDEIQTLQLYIFSYLSSCLSCIEFKYTRIRLYYFTCHFNSFKFYILYKLIL